MSPTPPLSLVSISLLGMNVFGEQERREKCTRIRSGESDPYRCTDGIGLLGPFLRVKQRQLEEQETPRLSLRGPPYSVSLSALGSENKEGKFQR